VHDYNSASVVLLKKDGTLWQWGNTNSLLPAPWTGFSAFTPQRLGTESNWVDLASSRQVIYAWQRDGRTWAILGSRMYSTRLAEDTANLAPGILMKRCAGLDHITWRSLASWHPFEAGIRADGSLWTWNAPLPALAARAISPESFRQIGTETNWVGVAGEYRGLVALKADGSIWGWSLAERSPWSPQYLQGPYRFSQQKDWVAIGFGGPTRGVLALAADGSLWNWWDQSNSFDSGRRRFWLGPSRKPVQLLNILERASRE
jgi:hypothetical protein